MALYAFDGTGNKEYEEENKAEADAKETNVVRFCEAYQKKYTRKSQFIEKKNRTYKSRNFYVSGVGTRGGPIGFFLGGVFGMGGEPVAEWR